MKEKSMTTTGTRYRYNKWPLMGCDALEALLPCLQITVVGLRLNKRLQQKWPGRGNKHSFTKTLKIFDRDPCDISMSTIKRGLSRMKSRLAYAPRNGQRLNCCSPPGFQDINVSLCLLRRDRVKQCSTTGFFQSLINAQKGETRSSLMDYLWKRASCLIHWSQTIMLDAV